MAKYIANDAVLSECGKYRYKLTRRWAEGRTCVFIMLNPSTADAKQDDPTIRRCIGFAIREGCCALEVLNLFAYRSSSPAEMKSAVDPVGSENDSYITELLSRDPAPLIVAAWSAHGGFKDRGPTMAWLLRGHEVFCLGKTKAGHPKHPVRLAANTPLIPLND